MRIAVSIVSKNRSKELRRTLGHLSELDPRPDEVIVYLDNCQDESREVIREIYPEAIVRSASEPGSIPSRDRIIKDTECEWVLSLDDDSYPIETNAISLMKSLARNSHDVGVFLFPQVSDEFSGEKGELDRRSLRVGSFQNSGALIRRDFYLQTDGYPHFFEHAYEEPDLVLQLMHRGYTCCTDGSVTIRHHYSQIERHEKRTHLRHARNEFLSTLLRAPGVLLPVALIRVVLSQLNYARKRGWILSEPRWWIDGIRYLPKSLSCRRAVSLATYREWRALLHHPKPV